jgi:cation:H+ antiporter
LLFDILRAVAGLAVLVFAADRLVRSAIRVSRAFGLSTVLIGAVVVGFGTSIPEFVVSVLASVEGELELAISNVVSSNTANVTLVLGVAALVTPLAARRRIVRREGALMFAAVVALAAALANGYLGMVEGFILGALLIGAIALMVRWSNEDPDALIGQFDDGDAKAASFDRVEPEESEEDEDPGRDSWRRSVGKEILIGIAALVITLIAADSLLDGVVGVGERLGWSVVVLGLVTGVGTSLPELAAGIAGARHGHPDLVIGNVVGSNVFNSLGVAGLAAIVGPGSVAGITTALIFIMVAAAFVAGAFAFTGHRISRIEGGVLLTGFVLYVVFAFS